MPGMGILRTVHDLELHDMLHIDKKDIDWYVLRVPGGWIYKSVQDSIFVPYNCEFKFNNQEPEYEVL